MSAGFGELNGADAVFLSCAYGAGLGVASLSVSYRSALSYQRSGHQALAYTDNHPGLPLAEVETMTRMQSDPDRYSMRRPAIAAILAAGVFLLDTLAPADIPVAVLYSAVVLLSIDFPWRRGILLTGVICACLTILSYLLSHGESYGGAVLGDCLMSLAAIGLTTVLAIRIRADSDALSEQAKALEQANADLAHATRVITLGELSTSIGHELKQPLAAIATNSDVCARYLSIDPPDLKEIREGVERIKSDVHRATQIINRLRALSQKGVHQKESIDINALVEETLLLLRRELSRRGISLQLDLVPGLPQIVGDRIQLQQVFLNLVMNASEAMLKVFDRPRELLSVLTRPGRIR